MNSPRMNIDTPRTFGDLLTMRGPHRNHPAQCQFCRKRGYQVEGGELWKYSVRHYVCRPCIGGRARVVLPSIVRSEAFARRMAAISAPGMVIAILAIAAVMPTPAAAADVFGMQLQAPFTVPECAFEKLGKSLVYKLTQARTCYQRSRGIDPSRDIGKPLTTDTVEIKWQEYPRIVSAGGYAFATVIDGNLEGLSFNTLGIISQDRDLQLLVEKFGQPTKLARPQLQNAYGAQYLGILASWDLDESISFESAVSVNSGTVIIDTPKGEAFRKATLARYAPKGPAL